MCVSVWHGLGHVPGQAGPDVEENRVQATAANGVYTSIARTGTCIERRRSHRLKKENRQRACVGLLNPVVRFHQGSNTDVAFFHPFQNP